MANPTDDSDDITIRDVLNILYSEVESISHDAFLMESYIVDCRPPQYADMEEDDFDDMVHEAVLRVMKNCKTDD